MASSRSGNWQSSGQSSCACDGNTELMKQAMSGNPEAVRISLDAGTSVDELNNYGWTALMHTAKQNETATMAVLLDAGADINHRDDDGWTALMVVTLVLFGFLFFSLGIIGEYLWRTLDESRSRPVFIVDETIGVPDGDFCEPLS